MVLGLDIASRKLAYPALRPFELKGGVLYGPIRSRRLGLSLGVNILPYDVKICTWDCLYCQCGWTDRLLDHLHIPEERFPSVGSLAAAFEEGFAGLALAGERPDAITLSGNGEPTLHPRFPEVVDALLAARDRRLPSARASVLSNGERLGEPAIRGALDRLDVRCMKLDAGDRRLTEAIDRPLTPFDLDTYVARLSLLKPVILQSFFLGGALDNTTEAAVGQWLARVREIRPRPLEVHLYSLDRVPPAKGLAKVPGKALEAIAERVLREAGCPARVFA